MGGNAPMIAKNENALSSPLHNFYAVDTQGSKQWCKFFILPQYNSPLNTHTSDPIYSIRHAHNLRNTLKR
jgi:hypothetical protein